MCDFSLQHVKSRPAQVGDKLVTKDFGSGTTGFADQLETDVAVCVMPGTEIAFDEEITSRYIGGFWVKDKTSFKTKVAIFRQINKDKASMHHDALEMPDGQIVLLTQLCEGRTATVLQLPAAPKNEIEEKEQQRLEVVG